MKNDSIRIDCLLDSLSKSVFPIVVSKLRVLHINEHLWGNIPVDGGFSS